MSASGTVERITHGLRSARSGPPGVPGDAGLPLIGHSWDFVRGTLATDRSRYDRYGPVSWLNALGQTWISAQGPEACGEVLQNRDRVFASGPGWGLVIGPFFRRGLMLLDGAEHHAHRRIMQEAFTSQRLAGYLEPLNRTVADGLAGWPEGGGELPFYPSIKQLTLDVATRAFMAGDPGEEADALNAAFVDAVRGGTAIVRVPVPRLRWARGLAGRRLLEDYLRARIPAHRAGDGSDLFGALCHAQVEDETFTDDDVVNHMIFLLMAAHDTATITMTTMAYYLAKHPEWQDRCREESLALGDTVAFAELDRLVALDLVMKEALRLVVPVPGVMRRTTADTELLGLPVPAGVYVAVNLYSVHHFREWWPDPERFDPGRFAEDRREDKVHRHAFMPFGSGVHKCIGMFFGGMEVRATMHQLLRRYRLSVPDGYEMPVDWTSLPRPYDGLPITLTRV